MLEKLEIPMHPRIQARRLQLNVARKQVATNAIADLSRALENASRDIERLAGYRPIELIDMAAAYRLLLVQIENAVIAEAALGHLCERICVSAQAALDLMHILVRNHIAERQYKPRFAKSAGACLDDDIQA